MSEIREQICQSIYRAIDEVNETLPHDRHIVKSLDTVLLGPDNIDSLGLTVLIVAVEQKLEEDFGVALALVDGGTMSAEDSPFRTIGTLVTRIQSIYNE